MKGRRKIEPDEGKEKDRAGWRGGERSSRMKGRRKIEPDEGEEKDRAGWREGERSSRMKGRRKIEPDEGEEKDRAGLRVMRNTLIIHFDRLKLLILRIRSCNGTCNKIYTNIQIKYNYTNEPTYNHKSWVSSSRERNEKTNLHN